MKSSSGTPETCSARFIRLSEQRFAAEAEMNKAREEMNRAKEKMTQQRALIASIQLELDSTAAEMDAFEASASSKRRRAAASAGAGPTPTAQRTVDHHVSVSTPVSNDVHAVRAPSSPPPFDPEATLKSRVLEVLRREERAMTVAEVAKALDVREKQVLFTLQSIRQREKTVLDKPGRGLWRAVGGGSE